MLYINDFCSIGPMGVFRPDTNISNWETPGSSDNGLLLTASEPDYKEWLSPMKQRRMSKPVRMAVAAMKMCFGVDIPQSIHIGSAFGQLSDSQQFLQTMANSGEGALPPTAFIQSTHNTVSGALAMEVGAHGHNFTMVNAGHSFEDAFFDSVLTGMELSPGDYQLLGAVDEMIPVAAHAIRAENCANGVLGEGCVIFKTTIHQEAGTLGCVRAFEKVIAPANGKTIYQYFWDFLEAKQLEIKDTDLCLFSGSDAQTLAHFFINNPIIKYKQFCGDYPTQSAFGLAYALQQLHLHQNVRRAWLLTNFGAYWSFWLIEK